jgi:hypothetical protein
MQDCQSNESAKYLYNITLHRLVAKINKTQHHSASKRLLNVEGDELGCSMRIPLIPESIS